MATTRAGTAATGRLVTRAGATFDPVDPRAPDPVLPPDVARILFDGAPQLGTYAVLDAATLPNLPELLDTSGLPHRCLFQGQAADEMGHVAPWLVALDPAAPLTMQLFTAGDAPFHLWSLGPGVLFRSRADLAAIRAHLRKMLRVTDPSGKAYFFRFWDRATAPVYFPGLADQPDIALRWFRPRGAPEIDSIVLLQAAGERGRISALAFDSDATPPASEAPLTLTEADLRRFGAARMQADRDALGDLLRRTFPDKLAGADEDSLADFVDATVDRMTRRGFARRDHLFTLLAWELFFGPEFESKDPELARIAAADAPADRRFEALKARMESLG